MKININIKSRLHITLISMHSGGYRQNGGIGFAIDKPSNEIEFIENNILEIEDKRVNGFTSNELNRTYKILSSIIKEKNFQKVYKAIIKGDIPTHKGFGSSTSIRLGLIEGLFLINNKTYTQNELISLSQRGGVSGIGINTYFTGGMIFDIGRSFQDEFLPSSKMEKKNNQLPLILKQIKMPDWKLGVCIPNIKAKSEDEEKIFFQKVCPIKKEESYEILYHSIYGVLGSVLENDIKTFAKSINAIQNTKWKKSERELYGKELKSIENILYNNGATCVGMSSLGPSLYFIAEDIDTVIEISKKQLPKCKFYIAHTNNSGRNIYD